MQSEGIVTIVKMMESLPEAAQNQVVEHLRSYVAELQDELRWDESFKRTESRLVAFAQQAQRQIDEGKARPLDHDRL
jgi:hypothetical protein